MKLAFGRLTIEKFKSFIKPTSFDFGALPVGLHFVRGRNECMPQVNSNGAGKSTFTTDALMWTLFGRTAENLRNPDIKPWYGIHDSTTTHGLLEFWIDETRHELARTANPNATILDGKKIGSQEIIDNLIGLSHEIVPHTILLPQGLPLFFDHTPGDKMKLFADVLRLERWEVRATVTSKLVKSLLEHEAKLNGQLGGLETTTEELALLIAATDKRAQEWETEQLARIKGAAEKVIQIKTELTAVEALVAKADLAEDGARTEAKALLMELDHLNEQLREANRTYDRNRLAQDAALTELARLNQELETLGAADKCPTCGQDIKGTMLAKHKAELTSKIREAKQDIGPAVTGKAAEPIRKKIDKTKKHLQEFNNKAELASSEHRLQERARSDLCAGLRALETTLSTKREEHNPFKEQARELKRKQQALETEQEEIKQQLAELSARIVRTKFWIKGFRDVRLFIIEDTLQELELVVNSTLADLGLDDWQVRLAIEKETKSGTVQSDINVLILGPDTPKTGVKWECYSGGERQRLRLLGALALSDVLLARAGVEPNLEVLDEPTHSLSKEGIDSVVEFLAERARQQGKHILLTDHHAIESARFKSTITVVRTSEGSKLFYD